MDDQIYPDDPFFGINLSDCVTVAANLPSNARTELQNVPKRPFEQVAGVVAGSSSKAECLTGDFEAQTPPCSTRPFSATVAARLAVDAEFRQACRDEGLDLVIGPQHESIYATGVMTPVPIMDSVVGLKAANAHLTRQLAAQALAHAEQMEGLKASTPKKSGSQLYAEMMGRAVDQCELTNLHRELAVARAFIEQLEEKNVSLSKSVVSRGHIIAKLESDLAMRVTAATQPTDAQQTASDVKAAPERRPDGTLKPAARTWEAPKRTTDVRRLGG